MATDILRAEPELTIKLYPRQHDIWIGSAAQLIAEGLVLDHFAWPQRTERVSFWHNGVQCAVQRRRGARGGRWVDRDWWEVWRGCKERGVGAPERYQARRAAERKTFLLSDKGRMEFERADEARHDQRFQAMLRRIVRESSHG
jgi:hypothetical protein